MKYAFEMGSVAVIRISSFIKTGSGILMLIVGIHGHTHSQDGDRISLLGESRLKINLVYELKKLEHTRGYKNNM
jgi:hypothetical protein